jgi:hypothetical protein
MSTCGIPCTTFNISYIQQLTAMDIAGVSNIQALLFLEGPSTLKITIWWYKAARDNFFVIRTGITRNIALYNAIYN